MKKHTHKAKTPGVQAEGSQVKDQKNHNPDSTPGLLLKRKNTVIAHVLAHMLDGHHVTGMEAVFGMSSTRLAHHVHALGKVHGWFVERRDKVVGCNDGRVQTISEYWLSPDVIEAAMAQGARAWISEVRKARAALRAKEGEAHRRAAALEAARKRQPHPGQLGLFGAAFFKGGSHGSHPNR